MFDWTIGTFGILLIGILLLLFYNGLTCSLLDPPVKAKVQTLVFYALVARLVWDLIYFGFIADSYPFMITDDYNYFQNALRTFSNPEVGRNNYQTFLNYLYYLFGASSFNGRLVNLFASVAATYPIAYIESRFNGNTNRFVATKLYCFLPFMVTISSFEIKDILSMLFFCSSCMMMLYMLHNNKIRKWPWLLVFCILSELMRSGMGLLVLGVYLCTVFYRLIKAGSGKKAGKYIAFVCLVALLSVGIMLLMSTEYYKDVISMLDQYSAGRDQSTTSGSMFDFLTIKSVWELWKIPLDLLFYVMLPNSSEHVGRFLFDFGVYLRFFDVPISILGVYWLIRNVKKFGAFAVCVLVPYCYLACIQIITFREVIFIMPLLYICGVSYLIPEYSGLENKNLKRLYLSGRSTAITYRMAIAIAMYIVWGAFIMIKVR